MTPPPSRRVPTLVFFCLAVFAAFILFSIVPLAPRFGDAPNCGGPHISSTSTTTEEIEVPCTKQCAPESKCVNDVCICDADHFGRRCQTAYAATDIVRRVSAKTGRDNEHTNSKLYFTSPTAQSRQQLAAVNLFHCPSIIEVGGLFAGTLEHLTRLGWTGNFTQMDMFGPQVANVTRTTLSNGEVRVRRVVKTRQLCGENATEEADHSCFVFIGIPGYGGMGECAAGVHSAKYQTIILESPFSYMFDVFATKLNKSPRYKSWGIAADWSEDLRRDGIKRKFQPRRFRVFTRRIAVPINASANQ